MFNSAKFNGAPFNGEPNYSAIEAKTFSPDQPYILHLMTAADVFVGKVEGWTKGSWNEQANAPGSLKITMPLDNVMVQANAFVNPRRIFIYDGAFNPLRRYVIIKTKADPNNGTYEIECAGLLYLLNQEFAPLVGVAGGTGTIRSQVLTLLAHQNNANPITLGPMAPEYANRSTVYGKSADTTILQAIMLIWKQVGGVIGTDWYGRLSWISDNPNRAEYTMSLYEDIETYQYSADTSKIINRIYGKTKINDDSTTHARRSYNFGIGGNNYIEDTDSQAIYGIRSIRRSYEVESVAQMRALMAKELARSKDPIITRSISAIDMEKVQFDPDAAQPPKHLHYIWPGAAININPPSNVPGDSSFKTIILSTSRDLSDPLSCKIVVGTVDTERTRGGGDGGDGKLPHLIELVNQLDQLRDSMESQHEQDDDIWEAIDGLGNETDGNIQPVGEANDAGTAGVGMARADHVHKGIQMIFDAAWTQKSDLGAPDGMAIGYLDDGAGGDEGFWIYPPDGTVNADWGVLGNSLIYDATWTQKSDLGNPLKYSRGYLDSGAGTEEGFWVYPPDGTTNADWQPENLYN